MTKAITSLFIGIIIVSVITVAITISSGNMFQRWGEFDGLEEARIALRTLPMEIRARDGSLWRADEERELEQVEVNMLRIPNAYISRVYMNDITGAIVGLTLMVGPTGRITVHTPEVCFGVRDFEQEGPRNRIPIEIELVSGERAIDHFWRVDFLGQSLSAANRFSFYYGVSTGDGWYAVENPRSTFQRFRFIYRIQVQEVSGMGGEGDNVRLFLEDALPTIREHLRPAS